MSNQENNQNKKQEEHFNVPNGYFEKSAANILNKIEWEEEMKLYPLLGKLKSNIGFIIPENYFEKSEIKIETLAYEKLAAIERLNAFNVPDNYFVEKTFVIKAALNSEEQELSEMPILKNLSKQNNFDLPESYFEENKIEIKNLLVKNKSAKIIPLSFSRMVMAAAAILIISLGLWVYKTYYQTVVVEDCGTLACIEKRELLKSKQLENLDNDELYELVNAKNLEKDLQKKHDHPTNKKDTSNKLSISDELLDEI
jgi:hypothetical protein